MNQSRDRRSVPQTCMGVVKLQEFINSKGIDFVWIDSAKSVASRCGWKYTDNDSPRVLHSQQIFF